MVCKSQVISVNQSPVKNDVIIPENVPTINIGRPKVSITSRALRHLSNRLSPSALVSTRTKPIADISENIIKSITFYTSLFSCWSNLRGLTPRGR